MRERERKRERERGRGRVGGREGGREGEEAYLINYADVCLQDWLHPIRTDLGLLVGTLASTLNIQDTRLHTHTRAHTWKHNDTFMMQ